MGKEVDIVSSQLSVHLSNGATRVVRAVGVDLHISMDDLFKVASAGNRKVEKILDSYGPGEVGRLSIFLLLTAQNRINR